MPETTIPVRSWQVAAAMADVTSALDHIQREVATQLGRGAVDPDLTHAESELREGLKYLAHVGRL
jgi:hypothetical protein